MILIAALSLLGSIFLSANANGIAVFMAFGAGLAAGLLGQIGDALNVDTLQNVAEIVSWALPFERRSTRAGSTRSPRASAATGADRPARPVRGRAGGAGPLLWPWSVAYLALLAGAGHVCRLPGAICSSSVG